ncbi:MAG: hypothetical protein GX577_07540 [Leptolinea sp.]|nr:hypothetical protein [Leptolinea sp.]
MKKLYASFLSLITLLFSYTVVFADGEPPIEPTSVGTGAALDGFPWGLVVVFIIAGFITSFFKKNNPNRISSTSCVPLPDEEQRAK